MINLCTGVLRTIDFDTDASGSPIPVGAFVDGAGLYSSWGVTFGTIGVGTVTTGPNIGQPRRLMTFPSESPTYAGPDPDLINIGSGLGNILIISDNNQGPAQGDSEDTMADTNSSGFVSIVWDRRVEILELTVIDADISAGNFLQGYADAAGTQPVGLNVVLQTINGAIQIATIRNTVFIERLDLWVEPGEGIGWDNLTYRECTCPSGQFRDCAEICGSIASNLVDCNGICFPAGSSPPNLCDCAGTCYDANDPPPSFPDCNGVCGGTSTPDCLGICDGDAVIDCNGVCDGQSYVDCGGTCIICNNPVTSTLCTCERFLPDLAFHRRDIKIKLKNNQKVKTTPKKKEPPKFISNNKRRFK